MSKTRGLLFTAGIALATAFTLSCSSDGDAPDFGGKGNDIKNYRTVRIGDQVWMAENLNYNVAGSKCYGEGGGVYIGRDEDDNPITKTLSNAEVQANCERYGRLYDWETAKTVCPSGWHLPSNEEWTIMTDYVGGSETAGTKLKAASGWNWNSDDGVSGNGTDEHGFSALPGGVGSSDGYFDDVGDFGLWWSATERDASYAYYRDMGYSSRVGRGSYRKSILFSVRCAQD